MLCAGLIDYNWIIFVGFIFSRFDLKQSGKQVLMISRGRRVSLSLTHCRPSFVGSSSFAVLHGRSASLINPTNYQRQPLLHPSSTTLLVPHRLFRTMVSSVPVGPSEVEWPARRVRETFIEYFRKNGHTVGWFFQYYCISCDCERLIFDPGFSFF